MFVNKFCLLCLYNICLFQPVFTTIIATTLFQATFIMHLDFFLVASKLVPSILTGYFYIYSCTIARLILLKSKPILIFCSKIVELILLEAIVYGVLYFICKQKIVCLHWGKKPKYFKVLYYYLSLTCHRE